MLWRKSTDVFSRPLFVFPLRNNEKTMTGKTPLHLFLLQGSQPKSKKKCRKEERQKENDISVGEQRRNVGKGVIHKTVGGGVR